MQDFRNLRVWHAARALSLKVVDSFPERSARRVPGLRSQAIRAAMSVSANLAEGCARDGGADFLRFVEIALSSLNELEAHLMLARDARMLSPGVYEARINELVVIRKMLAALKRAVQHRVAQQEDGERAALKRKPT